MKKEIEKKRISTGKKLLIIFAFSVSAIFLGVFLSFVIKFLITGITTGNIDAIDESLMFLVISAILGVIFFVTLIVLLKDYDNAKKEKNKKWYIDKILLALTIIWITIATVLFSFYNEDEEGIYLIFSLTIFLIVGILTTPNVVRYALNDMKNWKDIFHKNGNLSLNKAKSGFYKMDVPVSFEKKIYTAIIKEQILNLTTVALIIIFFIARALFHGSIDGTTGSGGVLNAIIHVKAVRAEGYMFFGAVFCTAFWIPIFAYYITNALYKLKIVKRHEYIAYHAIVDKVTNSKILIKNNGAHYEYNYCTCVGIKEKEVNKTDTILIFIPDDVLLFPDK